MKKRLLQTKVAKHRRELYALRAFELAIYKKRLRKKSITKSEYDYITARKKLHPKPHVVRQSASNKRVRIFLQIAFTLKKKEKRLPHARKRRQHNKNNYRIDIDRGNYKVRLYTEYISIRKSDLYSGNLSNTVRTRVEKYKNRFNRSHFDKFSASFQLFTGKILNPYSGLIGRPSSMTSHARMRVVNRRKDSGKLDQDAFLWELTEFQNAINYSEEVGFLNYSAEDANE